MLGRPTNPLVRAARVWIAVCAGAIIPYYFIDIQAPDSALVMSASTEVRPTVAAIQFFGALFACASAFVILMTYRASRNGAFLLLGLGFFIAASENLVNGFVAGIGDDSLFSRFVPDLEVLARFLLACVAFVGFLSTRPLGADRRTPGWFTRTAAGPGLVLGGFLLFELAGAFSSLPRPADLAFAALFLAAVPSAVRQYRRIPGPFSSSLVLCLLLFACSEIYLCTSARLFDSSFVASHVVRLGCYLVPLFGAAWGLVDQHGELERHRRKLEQQTALLWQQSEGLSNANKKLRQQAAELETANNLKSRSLANMSHELRTPLNAILGFSDSLIACRDTDPLTPWQQDRVGKIGASGEHLLNLIDDILDLAKIEAGRASVHPSTFQPDVLVEEVASSLAPLFEKKPEVELRIEFDPGLPSVWLDREKTKRILINLLSNACKFTDRGSVTVTVSASGERIRFVVEDTGIGIAEDHLEVIFDHFRQVDSGENRMAKGTGLGLALVKELTELMRGAVTVESDLGRGTRFSIDLPVALPNPPDGLRNQIEQGASGHPCAGDIPASADQTVVRS